ncbi:kinesin-like protein KIF22 isoform X2 [Mytilus galloprovincialis]|uniref:kinesin-like protein KIF22 isoform X2 n=1 Tax=Mytilus galloprovincialis TaxID=29158 RepID=UPI003F7B6B98
MDMKTPKICFAEFDWLDQPEAREVQNTETRTKTFQIMNKKQTKVNVVVRLRPALKTDDKSCVFVDGKSLEIFNHRNVNENIKYDFSAVYDINTHQQTIYQECVKPQLLHSLNGQNVSIFAYGPTGAGKTHTMLGSATDPGVIPRVINGIFHLIEEQKKTDTMEWSESVKFSYLEIYNEKVMDLLDPKDTDLPIREDTEKNILIPGLGEKEIRNFDEFKTYFGPASNNRTVAATKLNERSSRSHSILLLKIKRTQKSAPYKTLHGKIYLIDLAGSEDNRRTGNKGIRLKESGAINKSLFVLGEVVDSINCCLPRIPYRNSKLTRLLQDSIGGSCHSVMITNVAPEERYYYDTYCTLNFASKSKKIVNSTVTRETVAPRIEILANKTPMIQEQDPVPAKKPRLTAKEPDKPPQMMDPAPFLSPLLRRQTRLEDTVNRRLEDLEKNLLDQMKKMTAGQQNPPNEEMMTQLKGYLEVSKQQLQQLAVNTPPVTPKRKLSDLDNDRLKDVTNTKDDSAVIKDRPRKNLKKIKSASCISETPLYAPQPRLFKKGFKSTAVSEFLEITESIEEKTEKKKEESANSKNFNPELQQKMNTEFIEKLNISSVKDLQTLQTVGAKRAKLIYEWRENYGLFSSYEDLKAIPGFTDRYIGNLLKSNFVTVA